MDWTGLKIAFATWVLLVFMFGGFNAKDEEYKKSVQKYIGIAIFGMLILGWIFNSGGGGGSFDEDPPRPADIYSE